jgi:broad specificity phosphatase PhoE
MVICIRHGETDWNAKAVPGGGGKNPGGDAEILRGNIDVPLNAQGAAGVAESAHEICQYPVLEVRSTPHYLRDTQTRHIVSEVCSQAHGRRVPEVDAIELDPYDVGSLSGKPVINILPLLELLIEIPFLKAPAGESYAQYATDFANYFAHVYAEYGGDDSKAVVLVLHGNEFRLLPNITAGKPIQKYTQQKVKPGEFLVIH